MFYPHFYFSSFLSPLYEQHMRALIHSNFQAVPISLDTFGSLGYARKDGNRRTLTPRTVNSQVQYHYVKQSLVYSTECDKLKFFC